MEKRIEIPANVQIPYLILYKKLQSINPRLLDYIDHYDYTQHLTSVLSRNERHKRFRYLIGKHLNDLLQHFKVFTYKTEDNEIRRIGWYLYPDEIQYFINGDPNIFTQLTSHSLKTKLEQAISQIKDNRQKHMAHHILRFKTRQEYQIDVDRHFTINNKGEMTFTPKNKQTIVTDDDTWKVTNRQNIKYGKGIRKILENNVIKLQDNTVEYISNYVKSYYTFNAIFQIWHGDAIKSAYLGSNYGSNTASLGQSCMRHPECQNYLQIYAQNPDKVKILVAINHEDQIIGRALLWNPDNYNKKVMDRIYGNDLTIEAFKEYANRNDYAYKKYQSHSDPNDWLNAENIPSNVCVTLDANNIEEFPYMDSFKYAESIDTEITFYAEERDNYVFTNINGGYENNEDDDGYVYTEGGTRLHEDEAVYSEYMDQYYHEEDAVYSDYHRSYIHIDNAVEINGDYYHHDSEDIRYSRYEDKYFLEDDVVWVESMDDYILIEEAKEDVFEQYQHNDDMESKTMSIESITEHLQVEADVVIRTIKRYMNATFNENLTTFTFQYNPHVNDTIEDDIKDQVNRFMERVTQTT